jgi:hypothetical protein
MTVKNPAVFLQAGSHPAEDVRRAFDVFIGAGSEGYVSTGDLLVAESDTPAMSVQIAGGRALIQGTESTYSGVYMVENRGVASATIAAADVSNPRIDIVCATIEDSAYSGATDAWSISVTTGTAAASPVAPSLPSNSLLLCTVAVAAAASSIVDANLTDGRVQWGAAYRVGGTDVAVADGGTGSSTALAARAALGLTISSDVQAYSAVLDATTASFLTADRSKLDGVELLADVTDSVNVASSGAFMASGVSAFGATLVDDADAATALVTLGALDKTIIPTEIMTAASDELTAIVTATDVMQFRMPYAMTGSEIRASLGSACATGTFTVDVNVGGATVFSTLLTVDATEKTSTTAAIPAVLSVTAWADDAIVTIDVDNQGDGTATGLKITMIGTRSA